MLSLVQRIAKIPEADRAHVVRLTRSILNEQLLEVLGDKGENPIFKSKLASVLANGVRDLTENFPEADDVMPTRPNVRYEAE